MTRSFDVIVVGAGSFGAWTAERLRRSGRRVALVDAHGPGHARASSGGESRLIRVGYGSAALYSRWSQASLREWRALARRAAEPLFQRTGVLFLAGARDAHARDSLLTLRALREPHERLSGDELRRRFPQCRFRGARWGLLETRSGVLLARRAVQALVRELEAGGVAFRRAAVLPPSGRGRLGALTTTAGERLRAGAFVFACGAWLPRLFPRLLDGRIRPTRQEVFFYGVPAGDRRFAPPHLPAWIDFPAGLYGVPELDGRGLKLAFDRHGPRIDPDADERVVSARSRAAMRRALGERFPALRQAPLLETRVCQYENTWNGDFLIDRHPDFDDVWLAGGGSGHGFKHGPAVGACLAGWMAGGPAPEPRFALTAQRRGSRRSVF